MNVIGVIVLMAVFIAGVVFILFRRMRIIGVLFLVCSISFFGYQWKKELRWSNQFESVPDGASLELVISMLGKPSVISDSAHPPFGYSLSDNDNNITSEAWYVSFFFPEQLTFCFDNQHKLVKRYRFASP